MRPNRVNVVGHRGAAGVLPENTLEAFRYALRLGVDAVECDVHLTRDGRLVVMHDETADRTTDGAGAIGEMDFSEVRALDAGDGEKVPTLDEVLEAIQGRCGLLCELKADGTEAPAVDAVVARGMEADVAFISFSLDRIARVKALRDGLRVGAILAAPKSGDIERALQVGATHVGVHYRHICLATVERAKEAGVEIGAWTPNKLDEMKAMIALGVTHITTDRPDILTEYLAHRGRGQGAAS